MGKVKYLITRIAKMDKKAMLRKTSEIHKKTGKSRIGLFFDMIKCGRKYGAGYMDYDLYEMYNLTPEQRDTYLTRGRNNDIDKRFNNKEYKWRLERKDQFNTNYNKYLKRDWVNVSGDNKEEVIKFLEKHEDFLAKPINGSCGKNIEKIHTADYKNLDELYDHLVGKEFELEEIIKQHPDVSKIYPNSINTVRVVTLFKNNQAHVMATYFRIGNNGKFVDNFNSGGMVAPVNEETGEVMQSAIDKNKNLYDVHPATGAKIKGFKFPYWNEVLEMVNEASKVIPEMGYVGWDVAFTPDGPVLVEANDFPGHDIYQLPEHTPDKIGIYPKFRKIIESD